MVIRIGGDDEFAPSETQQIVLAHQPLHPLAIEHVAPALQFETNPPAAVAGELQGNALNGIAHFQVAIDRLRRPLPPAIESGPAYLRQPTALAQLDATGQLHFFFQVRIDEPRVVNPCSFRCSSTCCKHPRKKSISSACCPTLRSSVASRCSSAGSAPARKTPGCQTRATLAASDATRSS